MENPIHIVSVKDYTNDFFSGTSSLEVGRRLDDFISKHLNQPVHISMYGVENISPSFINGAFLYLIDLYGEQYYRKYIKIIKVSTKLVPMIKNAIDYHINQKKHFFSTLKTNNVFLGIDGSDLSIRMRYKIYGDVSNKIHHFSWNENDHTFDFNTKTKINNSDCFIGIWVSQKFQKTILEQANYAISVGKPCVIFCDKSVYIKVAQEVKSQVQLVRFDEQNQILTARELNKVILHNQVASPVYGGTSGSDNTALKVLGWTALGVAAIAALSVVFSENKK